MMHQAAHRHPWSWAHRSRSRPRRRRGRLAVHRLRGGTRRRRQRPRLGSRPAVHPLGDERLPAHAAPSRRSWPESGRTECPTGHELAERLFEPLAGLPEIAPNLRLGTRVLAIGREGLLKHEEIATAERGRRPFRILLADGTGREWTETADVVIDATGTWGHPNTLGDGGIPAPGERALAGEIRRDIPDLRGRAGGLGRQDGPPRRRRPLGADRGPRDSPSWRGRRRGRG